MNQKPKLLYLGFAFPPGVLHRHPDINPAGHLFETQLVTALSKYLEVRSVAVLPLAVEPDPAALASSPGLNHELLLLDKPPEVFYRWRSLARLKRSCLKWRTAEGPPDAILCYNLSPIYNAFLRWLDPAGAPRILLLADSASLGCAQPWLKRFRRRFKPFVFPDSEMLAYFDACIALSRATEPLFAGRHTPWLWMPGGCTAGRAPASALSGGEGPIRFGYFGSLGPHAGLLQLIEAFCATDLPNSLHVCGYGKQAGLVAQRCGNDRRLVFHGLLPKAEDCLAFAQTCDVLVNPRPLSHGNENNFPSKIFDYALSGRAVLSSRLSGVDQVLGPEGLYFEPADFQPNLRQALRDAAAMPRSELRRRGECLRRRITTEYSWERQAERMASFITGLVARRASR